MGLMQLIIMVTLLLSAIIFGFIAATYPSQTWTFWATAGGWIFFCTKIIYEHWHKLFFWVQKIKCCLFGFDTLWNMTVKYELESPVEMGYIKNYLLSLPEARDKIKITGNIPSIIEVRFDGLTIQFVKEDSSLEMHILDMPVTYNRANNIIDSILSPLFEGLERGLVISQKNYFLSIKFMEKNPFIGWYLQKISAGQVVTLKVAFSLDNNHVELYHDKLILRAESMTKLAFASRDVLALSGKASLVS